MAFEQPSGAFTLKAVGLPEKSYDLLASVDLQIWTPVAVAVSDAFGMVSVSDPDAPTHPKRFYKFTFTPVE